MSIIICWTKCWPCQFGDHDPMWHTWANADDITHAAATGQPDPSGQRCGCHCLTPAADMTAEPEAEEVGT